MTTVQIGFSRGWVELLQFVRDRTALIFTFAFPALLLALFGSIFSEVNEFGVSAGQIFAASMIAYGMVSTAFITMGAGLAVDREDGTLKRLRGTPVTALSYFLGKCLFVAVTTVLEVALLLAIGVLAFDLVLPVDGGRWLTFGWVFGLSVVAFTLLGIAASGLVRNARTAGAILNVPVVALMFISGVFIHPITQLPAWMITLASVFPVKWTGQGFRSVFLPDSMVYQEAGGGWELGRVALVLGAWCVIGLVLCVATFRWTDRSER
ncbi:MAG TPA: ABC transporter permease [Actinoplanes sp.]|nr:ABC transporter permease [Actinoplanes sp.]